MGSLMRGSFGFGTALLLVALLVMTGCKLPQQDKQSGPSRLELNLSKTTIYINIGGGKTSSVVFDGQWSTFGSSGAQNTATLHRHDSNGKVCYTACAILFVAGPLDFEYQSRVSTDGRTLIGDECPFGESAAVSNPKPISRAFVSGVEVQLYKAYDCGSSASILEWFVPEEDIFIRESPPDGGTGKIVTQEGMLPAGLEFS